MNRQTISTPGRFAGTPEQLEYEELMKKVRITTAKLRIAQEGVDVSSISKQKLDMVMRAFDDMEQIQRDNQQKTSKIQQESNIQIQKINQDVSKKMMDIQKKYQDIIKSLKETHPQGSVQEGQVVEQVTSTVEDVREKTHEEKVSGITDVILREMRDTVYKRVDEIMKTVDTRAEVTIGRGVNSSQEAIEELVDHTKQMTVESAIVGEIVGEIPDDKDIPVIVPEMMEKTEEEIAKRRGEHKDIGRIE